MDKLRNVELITVEELEKNLFGLEKEKEKLEKTDEHTKIESPVIKKIAVSGYKRRLKQVKEQIKKYQPILEVIGADPEDYQ